MAAGFARPSWPFSNSARTRARAAACAAAFSASASFLSAARRAFWRLMSFFCVTGAAGAESACASNIEVEREEEGRTEVCVYAFFAEEVAFVAGDGVAGALQAEGAGVEAAHGLVS